ncbi:MAG: cyanophycinase [Patiriisocius sp.]|jgi:cyanophycinase
MQDPKGTLISIGGNEDKGLELDENHSLDFIEDGILKKVVDLGGGVNAKIKVITSASSIPVEVGENYLSAFGKLECNNIQILNIGSKEQANDPIFIQDIEEADVVMFSGGDQRRLSQFFIDSKILAVLKRRYQEEDGFVIAGTSAGAVAMSETMVCGGSAEFAMKNGEVKIMEGLGFMNNVIIDSHFIKRGRFGRLAEAVARHPELLGVGLGEDTAIIITGGCHFETIGSGMIILFDGTELKHNTVSKLREGTPITIGNMVVHVLANNDQYDVTHKKLTAQPFDVKQH